MCSRTMTALSRTLSVTSPNRDFEMVVKIIQTICLIVTANSQVKLLSRNRKTVPKCVYFTVIPF